MEAKHIALSEGIKEALCLKGMITELRIWQEQKMIRCDNQSAIHLTKHQVYHERSKYIDIILHFVRVIVSTREVHVQKIDTKDNPSDMMTKVLSQSKFTHCMNLVKEIRCE